MPKLCFCYNFFFKLFLGYVFLTVIPIKINKQCSIFDIGAYCKPFTLTKIYILLAWAGGGYKSAAKKRAFLYIYFNKAFLAIWLPWQK